jgi:hypothetical protein
MTKTAGAPRLEALADGFRLLERLAAADLSRRFAFLPQIILEVARQRKFAASPENNRPDRTIETMTTRWAVASLIGPSWDLSLLT